MENMKWVFLTLLASSVLVWVYASIPRTRAGTHSGEGGTRPIWTDLFAGLSTIALSCIPASIIGYVAFLVFNNLIAQTDAWGDRWGTLIFWIISIISGVGIFFPVIWDNLWYTASIDPGFNGSIRPFGRRWRGRWLSEGDPMMPRFVEVGLVDMRPIIGIPITFTQQSKDKTIITCIGNWTYQVFDPDVYQDFQDQPAAFDIAYKSASREYIKDHTEEELFAPGAKNGMAAYVVEKLYDLARSYAEDPADPESLKSRVKVNIEELLPPAQETTAAGQAKADKIKVDAYIGRFTAFKAGNSGIADPVLLWEAFERYEGKRTTEQVIIQGLANSSDPIVAAGATYLANRTQQPTGGQ